ncbi:MAG: DUF1192 domain-containing protein [Rhodospirillaceae bacterium]|nr:DUF1192 domain-containing protein [Rhodospirillaceae bacterium]
MDSDDLEPVQRSDDKPDLELMSIDELNNYIVGLQSEIERARDTIARKRGHRSGAEAFFKS